MHKDPICGMDVKSDSPLYLTHEGTIYYFCAKHCLEKFAQQKGIEVPSDLNNRPSLLISIFKNKTIRVALVLIALASSASFIPFLMPFRVLFTLAAPYSSEYPVENIA